MARSADANYGTINLGSSGVTNGETLVLWRRREGLNQLTAAAQLDVHVDLLRAWESDRRNPPRRQIGKLAARERCFIARRRAGLKQREVADKLNCSRLWVIQMEEGTASPDRLCAFWGV